MEEVDKIILDSLKHLECDIEDSVQSLKQFDADMIVLAISSCLEAITPNVSLPRKLPPSMISRLKIASDLAECIKNLGFRGDMGYQTILYCNEVEVRRVLMFLIERLPRESNRVIPIEQTGYVPRKVKDIERNLRESLKQMWIPSSFINNGVRLDEGYIVNSLGNSRPLNSVHVDIPDPKTKNEILKHYWLHMVLDVTKQCNKSQLIPSLLFKDIEFQRRNLKSQDAIDSDNEMTVNELDSKLKINQTVENHKASKLKKTGNETIHNEDLKENDIDEVSTEINKLKCQYISLQEALKDGELKFSQILTMKSEEQSLLKNTLSKVKLKTKTLAIINKENKPKLKTLIQNASDRLVELANQWNEVQTPLLDEYKFLQSSLTTAETKLQEEQHKLQNANLTHTRLVEDLKEKTFLEESLSQKCQQLSKNNNRSAYTRRIMEIIINIRKQNNEIQKVLRDTREIQKEINNLTGQVDRSFTLSDELIFYDAKDDETARKAYKLLAALRDECGSILKAVTELGQAERESRNLQEQIEMEKSKDISAKLGRVCSDLVQIQKETRCLVLEN